MSETKYPLGDELLNWAKPRLLSWAKDELKSWLRKPGDKRVGPHPRAKDSGGLTTKDLYYFASGILLGMYPRFHAWEITTKERTHGPRISITRMAIGKGYTINVDGLTGKAHRYDHETPIRIYAQGIDYNVYEFKPNDLSSFCLSERARLIVNVIYDLLDAIAKDVAR